MGLTWKNVPSQNNAALVQTLLNAGKRIGGGISDLGTVAEEFATKRTEDETAKLLAAISTEENPAVRQTMIDAASAQSDFLDFDKIRTVSWELGAADRAEDLALFEDEIADANRLQEFEFDQQLESDAQLNRFRLADHEFGLDLQVADKQHELTQDALDADFERKKEEALTKHKQDLEDFEATAANEQALEALALEAENELKIKLQELEDEKELALQAQKNMFEANQDYLSELAAIPSGLSGIYRASAGGLEPTQDNVGYTKKDSAAYNSMRSRVFQRLGIEPTNRAEIDKFDRWAAQNIIFHDKIGVNDFTFLDLGNNTVNFGKAFQTSDNNVKLLADTYTASKTVLDIKASLYHTFSTDKDLKESGLGSENLRIFDSHYYNFLQHNYDLNNDDDIKNDVHLTAKNAKKLFVNYLNETLNY